jgi:lipoprotein-releasing system ATP-binding protein
MSHSPPNPTRGLVVRDISKAYQTPAGPQPVLDRVSFEVEPGQAIAITGPSGSGKSTLLNLIGSLDRPDSGRILFDGLEVTALRGGQVAEYRAKRLGFVFQDHHLLPQCTVLENVLLPALAIHGARATPEAVQALLERLGLGRKLSEFPDRLSGGERQRAAIARALVNAPGLLLCDEPTGNLDAVTAAQILDLFLEVARERRAILIVVTHNLALTARLDQTYALAGGSLVAQSQVRVGDLQDGSG